MEEIEVVKDVGFEEAQKIAEEIASKKGDYILLALFDRKSGKKFPNVDCCGENSWEIYAKNRGGNLKVKVGDYEFIFRVEQ